MLTPEPQIPLFQLVSCLSNAMDLVNPLLASHHAQVAYMASGIGKEIGLPSEQINDLLMAGSLHDSGAISLRDKLHALQFEGGDSLHHHAELGYQLLKTFDPFSEVANLVRFHHVPWEEGRGSEWKGHQVPTGSHLIHLADRVAVLIDKKQEVLGQGKHIRKQITEQSGKMFMPELVEAFNSVAYKDHFWLDTVTRPFCPVIHNQTGLANFQLNRKNLLDLSKLFSRIIDFRSRFTANHSSGVAASAEGLARLIGFSEQECDAMRVAGYLHDLGKLAVPTEILEKPGSLTEQEYNIIRSHSYHTYHCLEPIKELEVINTWGSLHHERINGKGYPFRYKADELPIGSRIMAVADVFTAITEDRPYRGGMSDSDVLKTLEDMAKNKSLDNSVVSLLKANLRDINFLRIEAQRTSIEEYRDIMAP